jgi:hypothetical protein
MASRLKRMSEEQVIHKLNFEMSASSEFKYFEKTISALYGVPGIGKSRFAALLGEFLQRKYSLKASGTYFLQCEPVNHPWKIRKDHLDNWPTFRSFIDGAEKNPRFVSTVKMWVIDTIDGIVPKAMSTICSDFGIADLRDATTRVGVDGWYAKAWQELRDELLYQILRLAALGPGVLILSHERYRKSIANRMAIEKASMDVSNSVYNAVGDACSMILRIRNMGEGGKKSSMRCLASLPSDDEDVKDNLSVILPSYSDGLIKFKDEKQAVDKLLSCFDNVPSAVKRAKKVKKKVRKVVKKRR